MWHFGLLQLNQDSTGHIWPFGSCILELLMHFLEPPRVSRVLPLKSSPRGERKKKGKNILYRTFFKRQVMKTLLMFYPGNCLLWLTSNKIYCQVKKQKHVYIWNGMRLGKGPLAMEWVDDGCWLFLKRWQEHESAKGSQNESDSWERGFAEHLREHAEQARGARLNHPTLESSVAPGFTCLLCQNTGKKKKEKLRFPVCPCSKEKCQLKETMRTTSYRDCDRREWNSLYMHTNKEVVKK